MITNMNEGYIDKLKVYKKENVEKIFGRDLSIECNYEVDSLFT